MRRRVAAAILAALMSIGVTAAIVTAPAAVASSDLPCC